MSCSSTLVASITAAALVISEGKSSEELAFIAAVFTQFADTVATISAQQDLCATGE